jgi:hypothetical protein
MERLEILQKQILELAGDVKTLEDLEYIKQFLKVEVKPALKQITDSLKASK